jgi:hypothetical protein
MATISFSKPPTTKPTEKADATKASEPTVPVDTVKVEAEEVTAPTTNTETAVVVAEDRAPVVHSHSTTTVPTAAGVEGEITMSDVKLPRINMVQKVGQLADTFHPGSILFEKQVILTDGKTAIDLTPIRLKKQYQQKVAWGEDAGEQPQVFDTAEEVVANGGSLEYGDENYYAPIAHIQFAIKLPPGAELGEELEDAVGAVTDLFPYEFNDERYALAIWTVGSSAFTALAKPILTAATTILRNGLYTGHYAVGSEVRKNARNSWYAPRVKFAGKHTPEAAAFFREIAGL